MRQLKATDIGAVCKIITAIGIKEIKGCFDIDKFDKLDQSNEKTMRDIGFGVMFDIAGVVIANIPKAEKQIQTFVASMHGMEVEEIKELSIGDYGEMIMEIVMHEDFRDFFGRVWKLINR